MHAPTKRTKAVLHQLLTCSALFAFAGCDNGQSILLYRLPYANGTDVTITRDHITHTPANRLDMVGDQNQIVAAQSGTIRFIVDSNTANCCQGTCSNNYVWIEHPFGEWTKYSHLATGSVTTTAGLSVGDSVDAGQFLGFESDVGRACGQHLHFEAGSPDDPDNPITAGGFLIGTNRIPRFCGVAGQIVFQGEVHTASDCTTAATLSLDSWLRVARHTAQRTLLPPARATQLEVDELLPIPDPISTH